MDQSKSLAAAAATLLACVFAVPSTLADEPNGQVRRETVKFQDLNLDTAAGVEALYKRIHAAAQRVCANSGPVELVFFDRLASAKCTRDAEARAIKEIDRPALTVFAANR